MHTHSRCNLCTQLTAARALCVWCRWELALLDRLSGAVDSASLSKCLEILLHVAICTLCLLSGTNVLFLLAGQRRGPVVAFFYTSWPMVLIAVCIFARVLLMGLPLLRASLRRGS